MGLDEQIYRALYGGDAPGYLTAIMVLLSLIGGGWATLALAPLIGMRRTRRFALTLAAAVAVQSVLVFVLKILVARERPWRALSTHPPMRAPPTDFSFPSGHAAGSFTIAVFVATVCLSTPALRGRIAYATIAITLAFAIALSRVYLGVHYPGDVTGGALLGSAVGFIAARFFCARSSSGRRARSDAPNVERPS